MEPNMDVSPYAGVAITALHKRIEETSSELMQQRADGYEDPVLIDDLELAKFMAGLVLNYLFQRGALDVIDQG